MLDYVLKTPPIIKLLLIGMVTILIVTSFASDLRWAQIQALWGLSPWKLTQGPTANGWYFGTFIPLVSYGFVHVGVGHFFANAAFLIFFGTPVAARLGGGGSLLRAAVWPGIARFLGFFLGGVVAAGLVYVALNWGKGTPVVGASGGVAALVGGCVRFLFRKDEQYGYLFGSPASLAAKTVVLLSLFSIGFELLTGFLGSSYMINGFWRVINLQSIGLFFYQIAWEAHIGGYLFGVLTYPFFDRLAGAEARVPVNIHAPIRSAPIKPAQTD